MFGYTSIMSYRPSRNVVLLGLTSFFNDFSSEMVLSAFPAFFISVLKAGAGSLGLAEGIADATANIIKIYSGRVSDILQRRKVFIVLGYMLSVITRPLYLTVVSVGGVIGLRITDRIGKGLRESPRDAVISLSTKDGELGRAFGFHRMMDTLGAILGPFVAYLILKSYPLHFDQVFLTAFLVGIAAIVSLFFIKDVTGAVIQKKLSCDGFSLLSVNFKRYLISLFFLSAGTLPVAVLLLQTQNIGLTIASIPLFYMVYNAAFAGFSFLAGKISDGIGSQQVLYIGYIFLIGGYSLLAVVNTITGLVVAFVVLGMFAAATDGIQRSLASELSPVEVRGTAIGFVNGVSGFGLLIAGIAGGYTWQHYGSTTAFIVGAIFLVVGMFVLGLVKRSNKKVLQ